MSANIGISDVVEISHAVTTASLQDLNAITAQNRQDSLIHLSPGPVSPTLSVQTYENLKRQLVEDILSGSSFTGEHRHRLKSLLRDKLDERLEDHSAPIVPLFSSESEPRFASEISFLQLVSNLLNGRSNEPTHSLSSFIDSQEHIPEWQSFLERHPPLEVLTPSSFHTIELARVLVRAFNKLVNAFLPIFSETESESLLDSVYSGLQPPPRSAICQLCMVFALGDQASNQQTRSLSIFWFENGRRYLDEILNDSGEAPLWTFRVYLMVAIYYIGRKRNASRHYVEIAVGLARSHSEIFQVNKEPYLGCTLTILDRYLSIFLGRRCLIPLAEATFYVQGESPMLESSIPQRFARLSLIAGQILEEVYSSLQIRYNTYEGYLQQLDSWAESLPANQGVLLQTGPSGPSRMATREDFEGEGLNTHLAFLTVKILLSRPLLIRSVTEMQGRSDHSSDSATAATGADTPFSIQSAMEYVSISYTHFVDKKLQMGCWFFIHGVFNAFLVVVLQALRQWKLGGDSIGRSGDMDQVQSAITSSITLLEYHSKVNEIASLYLKVARSIGRSLGRFLANKDSEFGQSSGSISELHFPLSQNQNLEFRLPEQQSEMFPQPPTVSEGGPAGLRPNDIEDDFKHFAFSREQELNNWQPLGSGMDESIDPSLLETGQGFP
ncbi:hypothetical protein FGG08_001246 [Glutinoglossum americanum]|uniref:Transcription factor domain-containing protein n=1 Tax=Glutinoglossum americanum TaxID=1670608 RepID=A0A9P8IF31_9PEZI|nr:hypothetical protein FGG08_001246 [Glutinoglossum americanum]